MFFSKSKKLLVGVDVSASSVKIVQFSGAPGAYKLESYGIVPLPQGVVTDSNITDLNQVGEAIKVILTKNSISNRLAAVAVYGSAVITKVIPMNENLTVTELEDEIHREADQYIPYPLEEVMIDFEVVGPSLGHAGQVDVLLVASRKENVEMRLDALAAGGFDVKVVDVEAFTIERAFSLMKPALAGKGKSPDSLTCAIFDIGSTVTTLNVLVGEQSVYTREQLFGGGQLVKAVQEANGISYEKAAASIKSGNLNDDYKFNILPTYRNEVVQQVDRSLQVFFSSSQHDSVDYIILAGGTASTPELVKMVNEKTGMQTILANPFSAIEINPKVDTTTLATDAPSLMIACGLAMRSF